MRISSGTLALIIASAGCHPPERPTSPVSAEPGHVTAHVDHLEGSRESVLYWRVLVAFENHGAQSPPVDPYRPVWSGGSRTLEPRDLVLAAGETRTRSARVYTGDTRFESTVRVELCR